MFLSVTCEVSTGCTCFILFMFLCEHSIFYSLKISSYQWRPKNLGYTCFMRKGSDGKYSFLDSIHIRLKFGISCHIIIISSTICHLHYNRKCSTLLGIFSFWSLRIDFGEKVSYCCPGNIWSLLLLDWH